MLLGELKSHVAVIPLCMFQQESHAEPKQPPGAPLAISKVYKRSLTKPGLAASEENTSEKYVVLALPS